MKKPEENSLNTRGVRPTAIRILILQYLTNLGDTTSLLDLETHFDYADKSTLFRTLKTFEKNGIVHKIDDGSGIIKYGLCTETCNCIEADQHYHFHCQKCEETYCLPQVKMPEISLPTNFTMTQSNLVLKGICSFCN